MNDGTTVRKLRAIMFSDIVGYSKMMQINETEALKLLQKHKDAVIEISAKYGGKIIKYIGDEILIESESAVMLVYCAKELQKYFADRNATVPKSRELWVRIGIHIGDVIMKEDDIFGDGVNIASRIRPLANPGGIVITGSVLILLGNQDDIKCDFVGNKKLKNIKDKVKVYEVLPDSQPVPNLGLNNNSAAKWNAFLKVKLPISVSVFFLFLILFLTFFNKITDYEEEYFQANYKNAHEITKDFKSLKNTKANYFNISSANQIDSSGIINYYQDIYNKNRDNPKAQFYLGLAYLNFHANRSQLDSAYILFKEAGNIGINSAYFKIAKLQLYKKLRIKSLSVDLADELMESYPNNPLVIVKSAEIYSDFCNDDEKAEKLYRLALGIFPEFVEALNGLSEIEFKRLNYKKAKLLSDSSLTVNSTAVSSIEMALKICKSTSDFERARKILDYLPDNSAQKYLENANISLLENEPSSALKYINDGLSEFPGKNDFALAYNSIQKIILLSDSIQKNESSLSRGKNQWMDSWETAVRASQKDQKPLLITVLDNETLSSKFLELALSERDIVKLSNETVLYKIFRHKDQQLIREFGVKNYPAILFVNSDKKLINSFVNTNGYITDTNIIRSFITGSVLLNDGIKMMNKDTEDNKCKNAKNFTHAEELALEFELPVITVLSSKKSVGSENYLKHTIFNPGFMKNYKKTVFLSVEDAETSDLAVKYKISKFPTILFFDEDINLISSKYGVMPQEVLAEEIDKVKLFRKRKDMLKDEINWTYDIDEALSFARNDKKPVFVYFALLSNDKYKPDERIFSDYETIKKINTSFIPLFIGKESNSLIKDNSFKIMPSIAIMNQSGELLYQSPVSDDKYILDSFLDFKTNTDLLVSLGRNEFNEFLNKNETLNSLIKNKLRLSTEKEAMLFMIEFPSSAYGIVDFAEFLMSVKNDFLSSEHYLKFLKEKEFLVSEKFLKILVSSFMLHDDFDRLSDFINFLIVKFKNDPMAASSLYSALAEINLAQSLTIEAINFAEKSYSLDPKRVDNLTLLGMLNFNINKGQSEKYFRSALIHDPENIIANSYLYKITNEEKYSTAAKQAYYSGRDDFFGLRFFSNSIHFNNVGILELRDRAYRIKIELFPEKSEFKNDLAKFIADNKGDMAEALEITKALLAQEPNNQDFLSTASWVFYNLGDFSSADKLITKALGNISPDEYYRNQFIFYYLGMIKSAIGDNRSASYYFEKLISYKEKEDIDFNKFNYAKKFIESIH